MKKEQILKNIIKSRVDEYSSLQNESYKNTIMSLFELKKKIRLLSEEAEEIVAQNSTGINVLSDVLKQIIPIIKQSYDLLTTSQDQRKSFRAHIVQNALNTIMQVDMTETMSGEEEGLDDELPDKPAVVPNDLEGDQEGNPIDQDIESLAEAISLDLEDSIEEQEGNPEDSDKKIPIEDDDPNEDVAQKVAKDSEFVEISGLDATGRNLAYKTFPRIKKQIADAYAMLFDPDDKEEFSDYLIANLKLYFDQFDKEMEPMIDEPSSKQYNQIQQRANKYSPQGLRESRLVDQIIKLLHDN